MNSPVQVVLNSQDYVRLADVNPGGSNKDFYADRDAAFVQHREKLRNQVLGLEQTGVSKRGGLIYAHVALQADAWAKSHRPVNKIFPGSHVGPSYGGPLGSIVVELEASAISRIAATISSAEPQTNWVLNKDGKRVAKPSRERSEVGAIESVRVYSSADRRNFSLEQAVEWLSDRRTGGSYYIETFISDRSVNERQSAGFRLRGAKALAAFRTELIELGLPIKVTQLEERWVTASLFVITINPQALGNLDEARRIHEKLIGFLDEQPIVRSILLPPVLQAAKLESDEIGPANLPVPANVLSTYPVVGVIDSGVTTHPALAAWSAGDTGMVFGTDQDVGHGTFIAGLICGADALNSHPLFQEQKCRFFDLGLHPTSEGSYGQFYPRGFVDFLEQLDAEIPAAKMAGARVFNMSLAVTTPVADTSYSIFANLLDEIADRHDILFVLPAGNLDAAQAREEWPSKPTDAMEMLVNYRHAGKDRIFQPADSIRSLVVGAVNPPDEQGVCLPARYSRRGPGPSLGAKPDICHVGGKLDSMSGLCSISADGNLLHACGTSFAAPLAAKTLAAINHEVVGKLSREALIALAIHHADLPAALTHKKLKQVIRDFVGAGIPRLADHTLQNEDSEITLVFSGVLSKGQELRFAFAWPKSLVTEKGACSGSVKVTLVHRPPIDRDHAGEFVRVNLDVYLRQEVIDQETGEATFKGRLKQETPSGLEKERVQHGAKWWPVKRSMVTLDEAGNSSQWRLVVDSLSRSEYAFPEEGVPFTVLMTISDDLGLPIFNEMRQQLQVAGAQIDDIRAEIRPRVAR
ncbi:S8 family peptidase [Variovorax arabinosiphilus]|uniref:S8 family peptidase n=1 Tax=Variovorax arabinosiphilus TaxID=3053498 RepID=UPI0025784232|nr:MULTISPECIES: S8 family peptidase [unclassified Variovorax]MDM0119011.1 S8 family peptidase [Variovorax sp. J2L1-78]MDM0129437.1 S8 family peptidase [Variovorax sp. J2L1-63]MDM0232777.1 S8 family peptidase [Variovorax sp. J2R1-6]